MTTAVLEKTPLEEKQPVKHRNPARYGVLFGLLVLLLLVIAPLLVVVINAIKSPADYASNGPLALPHHLYFKGIVDFWNRVDFGEKLFNSFISSLAVAVLGVLLSILNAYALGIGRVKGRVYFLVFFLVANLLPQEALIYPLYFFAKQLGLYDSLLSIDIIFTVPPCMRSRIIESVRLPLTPARLSVPTSR